MCAGLLVLGWSTLLVSLILFSIVMAGSCSLLQVRCRTSERHQAELEASLKDSQSRLLELQEEARGRFASMEASHLRTLDRLANVNRQLAEAGNDIESMRDAVRATQTQQTVLIESLSTTRADLERTSSDLAQLQEAMNALTVRVDLCELSTPPSQLNGIHRDEQLARMTSDIDLISRAIGAAHCDQSDDSRDIEPIEEFQLADLFEELREGIATAAGNRTIELSIDAAVPACVRGCRHSLKILIEQMLGDAFSRLDVGEFFLTAHVLSQNEYTVVLGIALEHQIDGCTTDALRATATALSADRAAIEMVGGQVTIGALEDGGARLHLSVRCERAMESPVDHRTHIRLPQELLTCNLGQVMDLSLGGMRIRCSRRRTPLGEVDIELADEVSPVSMKGDVVWSSNIGSRQREVGIRFHDMDADTIKELTRISIAHRCRGAFDLT